MPPVPEPESERIGELYAGTPDSFVASREELVRALRSEGRADLAAEVHALRRPTAVAWSINQVARDSTHRVTALIDATDALEADQRAATAGTEVDLRAATRRRRAVIDELTDAALEHAARLGGNPSTQRDAITATLDAASVDPDARILLQEARLTKEMARATGFGVTPSGGPGPVADAGTARPGARTASPPPPDELARRRAEGVLAEAREEARTIQAELEEAEHAREDAETEVAAAAARVRELEAALPEARAAT